MRRPFTIPFLLLLPIILELTEGANILVYNPTLGTSHSNFLNKISDILLNAGHKVVQLQPVFNPNVRMGETKAEVIKMEFEFAKTAVQFDDEDQVEKMWLMDGTDPLILTRLTNGFRKLGERACSELLDNTELVEKLRSFNFDLGITEAFDGCSFGLFHHLNIPQHSTTMSMFLQDRLAQFAGVPTAPSYVPALSSFGGAEMSFSERVYNLYITIMNALAHDESMELMESLFWRKFGPQFPAVRDLLANSSLIFTNTEPLFDFPRPTIAKMIDIGGISVPPRSTEKLDESWDRILELRSKTIIISFGSISKSSCLPKKWKETIQTVLRRFTDVTFIWKYEKPEHRIGVSVENATSEGDNLITTTWMPQARLLSDRRLSGFITHGGIGSVNEATLRGVPMLVIPAAWDQFRNARMVERTGNALCFAKEDFDHPEKFHEIVKKFLESEKLRSNALRLERMIEEKPFTPEETFIKNINFILKHGPLPQLIPHGRKLSFIQYFLIDILLVLTVSIVSVIALVVYLLRKFLKISRGKVKTA